MSEFQSIFTKYSTYDHKVSHHTFTNLANEAYTLESKLGSNVYQRGPNGLRDY